MYHNRGKHTLIKVLNVKQSETVNWSIQYFEKVHKALTLNRVRKTKVALKHCSGFFLANIAVQKFSLNVS